MKVKNSQKNQYDFVSPSEHAAWHSIILQTTHATTLPENLIQAYLAAQYQAQITSDCSMTLHIGKVSKSLVTYMHTINIRTATYLTACNPASRIATPAANQSAMTRLHKQLSRYTKHIYAGESIDPAGKWPAEASFLALGIDLPTIITIGQLFGQNAIVWINSDAIPKLVLLR